MPNEAPRFFHANAAGVAPGGHYSHAARAGGFVFVSGQLPIPPGGVKDPSSSIREQTRLALANVEHALRAAGCTREDVVKVTAYLTTEDDWLAFNEVYAEFFGEHRPARAVVPVRPLHYGLLVEIDAIAWAPGAAAPPG
jgi:2-iminobutanoate/2-iminopropanoate deaminase